MAQSFDLFPNEPFAEDKPKKEAKVHAAPTRSFKHEIIPVGGRAAATTPNAPTTTLTDDQLKQCGNAYINNGIVRGVVDRSVFFIQGERTRAMVEANDELLETSTDEEAKELEQQIADDTLTIGVGGEELEDGSTSGGQPARIKELKRKIVRLNKRVKLHSAIEKMLTSALVFGRGFIEIVRIPSPDYPNYGEPVALKHLSSKNVVQCYFNSTTGVFEGIDYNTGKSLNPIKTIKAADLIPAFHDDNNIYENTQGSGLSAVWPILSVSQADDVINDEDIPEITKNTGGVLNLIYGGTNDDNKLLELKNKIDGKTQIVHGLQGLDVKSVNLGRDPHELTDVRTANGKYICQCMNLPLFLMYEDTANFATANQTMQVYKAGILKRYRTWLQGILEDYWYDTILADHLRIEIKDVISAPIKVKAIFPDINFETRKDVIEADKILFDMKVLNRMDVAKDIDRKDIVPRLEEEEAQKQEEDEKRQQDALANLEQARQQQEQQKQQANVLQFAQQAQAQKQASAAASIKATEDAKRHEQEQAERELRQKRIDLMETIKKKAESLT